MLRRDKKKKQMKTKTQITKSVLTVSLMVIALLLGTLTGFAQNFQGLNTLQNVASEGQSAGKYIINISFVFCGIVGAIMLIPAAIKAFKGEQTSRDAITNVGLGLIAVFVILAIIKVAMAFN